MSKKINLNEFKELNGVQIGEENFGTQENGAFGISQEDSIEKAFPAKEETKTEEREENKLEREINEREKVAEQDYKEFAGIPLGDFNSLNIVETTAKVDNSFRDMVLNENVTSFVYKTSLQSLIDYVKQLVTVKDAKVITYNTTPADFMRNMGGVVFGDWLKHFFPSANSMSKRGVFFHSLLGVECSIEEVAKDSGTGVNTEYSNFLEEAMAQNPDTVYDINNADILFGVQIPKCIITDYKTNKLVFFVNTLSALLSSLNVSLSMVRNMSISVAETSDGNLHIFVNKNKQ